MRRLNSPALVSTSTERTISLWSGKVLITRPKGHWDRVVSLFFKITISPSVTIGVIPCQMNQKKRKSQPTISWFLSNLPSRQNFSCWFQQTKFFDNRLRFRKVMDDIRRVGVVINEAERLRKKSSTNFKTKFLPEYSFNCCKNLKSWCHNYPASTCAEIMQNIHGLTPFLG